MISLVVPSYNERANMQPLVERLEPALASTGQAFEVIVVDDASPDGTADEVRRLGATRPWLRVLVREAERDLSTAVIAGWRIARGDVMGCMDADLQQPPELIPRLFARLEEGQADLVLASRHVKGGGVSDWNLLRRFISWTATLMATFILPGTLSRVRDPMSGFFLARRAVIEGAAFNPIGYKILLEVLAKGNYSRVEEVPFTFEERRRGGSKLGSAVVLKYLAHLVRISIETGEFLRIGEYAMVGLIGAGVNTLSLSWLTRHHGWPVPEAALAGAGLAIINNFTWNELVTFQETRRAEPGLKALAKRFLAFVGFSSAGVGLNVLLITVFVVVFGWPLIPGVIGGISIAAVWNFFINSNVTWRAWWNRKILSKTARPVQLILPDSAASEDHREMVPCGLCGSPQFAVLYTGNAARASAASHDAQIFRCTSEGHGDFTNIVRCRDCGLIYQSPREKEAAIESEYAQVEDPIYERETSGRIRTFSRLLDRLETFGASGRLADIGCYTGVFLDLARQRGWQVVGIEPSQWAAGKARAKGLEVRNAPFRKAELEPETFDVVTLWDVIEHLHDPLGDLRAVRRLLRPGGILGMSTMDTDSMFARLAGRRWPWYMRMHFFYFTKDSITRMLNAAGFKVLAIEPHKRVVSVRYFVEKAAHQVPGMAGLGRLLATPFGKLHVTVDLGDIMNIFAARSDAAS